MWLAARLIIGGIVFRLVALVLGLACLSAVGLLLSGHPWQAVGIVTVGLVVHSGAHRLVYRRGV